MKGQTLFVIPPDCSIIGDGKTFFRSEGAYSGRKLTQTKQIGQKGFPQTSETEKQSMSYESIGLFVRHNYR